MTGPSRSRTDAPADPAEAADYWAAKRMLGSLTPREDLRFRRWLAEPGNAAAYAEVQTVDDLAAAVAADPAILAMRNQALGAPAPARAAPWRIAASIATVVLIGGGAVGGWLATRRDAGPYPAATLASGAAAVPGAKRYETRVGEHREVRLDDGSVVALNTSSLLEVAYSPQRRDLRLLRGQALFQVAHNKAWPFVVTAGDRQVTAVGTAFDVRLDEGRVKVVLVEGRVRIDPLKRDGLQRLIPQLVEENLTAGQQLSAVTGEAAVTVAAADVARVTSWRDGQAVFRDDTLADAAAELNRYSDRRILVTDPRAAALKVSGVFGVSRPENFVAAVTAVLPVEASEPSPGVTELRWRGG